MTETFLDAENAKSLLPLLQGAIEDGILTADSVLEMIMATKRQQVLSMPPLLSHLRKPRADAGRPDTEMMMALIRALKQAQKNNWSIS